MIEIGQIVGNYKVTAKLGEGGMGVVFLVEHPVIGRRAALKAIHPEFSGNVEVVSRFVNEARSISQIGHDHIIEITDFGRTPAGDFYFIMEYLPGATLADRITHEAPLPPERALSIAAQIADALAASHACGVIHRDLKPENVILIERGGMADFVKVLDFGLAKLAGDRTEARKTHTGVIMGTPFYMAPEQCQGGLLIDPRTDVYALGVMLFEMLTGHVPFGGETSGEILAKQMSMPAPAARSLRPNLPAILDVILHRALAKKQVDRFPSMAAFRDALLEPSRHAGSAPAVLVHDDLSSRVRAARPMARSDIRRNQSAPLATRSTLRHGVGELIRDAGRDEDLVPARHRGSTWVAVAVAAAAGAAIAFGLTHAAVTPHTATAAVVSDLPARPAVKVRVTFGSDPYGATVVAPDGKTLGETPLSVDVPWGDAPVDYTFRRQGFVDKTMTFIPNVPSPLFAIMQAETAQQPIAEIGAQTVAEAAPRRATAPRSHRPRVHRAPPPPQPLLNDGDDVLTPSFE